MPTLARRHAAQQERERDQLQARRLRTAELFAIGVRQAKVARQLGVSPAMCCRTACRPIAPLRCRSGCTANGTGW
jgi:hypothetical protein